MVICFSNEQIQPKLPSTYGSAKYKTGTHIEFRHELRDEYSLCRPTHQGV